MHDRVTSVPSWLYCTPAGAHRGGHPGSCCTGELEGLVLAGAGLGGGWWKRKPNSLQMNLGKERHLQGRHSHCLVLAHFEDIPMSPRHRNSILLTFLSPALGDREGG